MGSEDGSQAQQEDNLMGEFNCWPNMETCKQCKEQGWTSQTNVRCVKTGPTQSTFSSSMPVSASISPQWLASTFYSHKLSGPKWAGL